MSIKCISCPHRNQFVRSYCKSSNKVGFPFPRALHPLFLLSCSSVSFETLAAALIIGLFALFIVVYTICLQCCWSNRRCPWFLDKEDSVKDKYTFCPCVQGIQSPESWQSAPDLEQVRLENISKSDYFLIEFLMNISGRYSRLGWSISPCLCEHECQSCRLRLRQNLQNVSWIGQKILRDPDVSSSSDNYSSGRGKSGTQTATLLKKRNVSHHHNHSTLFLVVPCHYKILLLNACCAEKHW